MTREAKRLARLRLLPDEKLQQAKRRELQRVRDIETIQKERRGYEQENES